MSLQVLSSEQSLLYLLVPHVVYPYIFCKMLRAAGSPGSRWNEGEASRLQGIFFRLVLDSSSCALPVRHPVLCYHALYQTFRILNLKRDSFLWASRGDYEALGEPGQVTKSNFCSQLEASFGHLRYGMLVAIPVTSESRHACLLRQGAPRNLQVTAIYYLSESRRRQNYTVQ